MADMLYVNGRFLMQTLSGVQRFATEITAELQRRHPGRVVILGPHGANQTNMTVRMVGRRTGQAWEQTELPAHVNGGVLINLGNTAPLRVHAQVVVIHDAGVFSTPEAYSWKFRLWYKFVHKQLVRRGARVVTVSEFGRRELVRWLGARPEDISVISEGADHMQAITTDYSVLAGIPPGRFVLAVGNLAAHKNLVSLAELARRLAQRNVSLVITGGLAAGAFRAARLDALPQPACYVGRVSDGALKALYESAACLVFPSHYEGFGLPPIEAMACGCPVVAAHIPALQETCGDAAQYCDPASQADIADQVCRVLDDSGLEAQLRAAAREWVVPFTWTRAADALAVIADRCHHGAMKAAL